MCIITVIQRITHIIARTLNYGKPSSVDLLRFGKCLESKSFVMLDGSNSYNKLLESKSFTKKVLINHESYDKFNHLNAVNSFHKWIEEGLQKYKGVASKYINRYNTLFVMQREMQSNYYFENDGKMAMNKWIGNYYVGEDGCAVTNQWIGVYYVGSNGAMVTGWRCIFGQWYYFDSNDIYQTGERYLGGEYYYFNSQGVMQTGTAEDGWEYNGSGKRMLYWSKRSNNPVYHRTPDNVSPKI